MQRPDENKRRLIVSVAAKMFASKPFHKVRLDDIAAAAKIGKGTLYIYFDNKEELYFSLIFDGLTRLVKDLRQQLEEPDALGRLPSGPESLRRAVDSLVAFAFAHPHLHQMMRNVGEIKQLHGSNFAQMRQEFIALVARSIRRGVADGDLHDPNPEITAACLGGMVRSIMLFGPKGLTETQVADQIYHLLARGIVKRKPVKPKKRSLAVGGTK